MRKYIDADKLIVGIEHLYPDSTDEQVVEGFSYGLDKVKSLITSLQQEQSNDLYTVIKEYYGEELPFEDERTKAAYHFFVAGKCYKLKEIEEDEIKCSPIMKEFIDKSLELGNTFNYGFGLNIQQKQPGVNLEKEITDYF